MKGWKVLFRTICFSEKRVFRKTSMDQIYQSKNHIVPKNLFCKNDANTIWFFTERSEDYFCLALGWNPYVSSGLNQWYMWRFQSEAPGRFKKNPNSHRIQKGSHSSTDLYGFSLHLCFLKRWWVFGLLLSNKMWLIKTFYEHQLLLLWSTCQSNMAKTYIWYNLLKTSSFCLLWPIRKWPF